MERFVDLLAAHSLLAEGPVVGGGGVGGLNNPAERPQTRMAVAPRGPFYVFSRLGGSGWGKTEGCSHKSCTQGFALLQGAFCEGVKASPFRVTGARAAQIPPPGGLLCAPADHQPPLVQHPSTAVFLCAKLPFQSPKVFVAMDS